MTLMVTGATGHVGGEILRQAARRGIDVIAVSRDEQPDASASVRRLRLNLDDAAAVRAIAEQHKVDACIHAAAISNEAFARPDPLGAIMTNVGGTANLLEAARVGGWRFVLISTGSVFSLVSDATKPIFEDQETAPQNVYSTTKRAAEMLTRMYRTEYGLSASAVRISWVFGPPVISDQPMRGPIPSYLLRALRGEAIQEGGADFAASFTYVADVAEALLAAASAPELRHPIYHFGHGINFTAGQAADAVRKAVPGAVIELSGGTEPWTRYTALRGPLAGGRFREDTGYTPAHTLESGIAAYADWMRANPQKWRQAG
jgi:nucleoside-diphosphate-sugar epimerase